MPETQTEIVDIVVRDQGDGTRKVKRGFDDIAKSVDRTDSITRTFRNTLATLGIALSAQQFFQFADAATQVRNILQLSTQSTEEFEAATKGVQATAIATGADIVKLAETYDSLSAVGEEFNATQAQILSVTDTLTKAFAAEGQSGSQAAAAVDALARSFLTGEADMRGMITLFKQSDDLTQALAKQFGATTEEFIKMVSAGRVSSEALFQALIGSADDINAAFQSTDRTIAQTLGSLSNALIIAIDQSTVLRATVDILGQSILFLANNIDTIIPLIIYFGTLWGINATLGMLEAFRASTLLNTILGVLRTSTNLFSASIGIMNAVLLASPIGITLTVLAALGATFIIAYQNSETFRAGVQAVLEWLSDLYDIIAGVVIPVLKELAAAFFGVGEAAAETAGAVADTRGSFDTGSDAAREYGGRLSFAAEASDSTSDASRALADDLGRVAEDFSAGQSTATGYSAALAEADRRSEELSRSTGQLSSSLDDVAGSFDNAASSSRSFSRSTESNSGGGGGGTFSVNRNFSDAELGNLNDWFFALSDIPAWKGGPTDEDLAALMERNNAMMQENLQRAVDREERQTPTQTPLQRQQPTIIEKVEIQILTPSPPEFLRKPTQDQIYRGLASTIRRAQING